MNKFDAKERDAPDFRDVAISTGSDPEITAGRRTFCARNISLTGARRESCPGSARRILPPLSTF
jgi:hypothetical protein